MNVIQFRLLGLLRGCAVLRGTWSRPSQEQFAALRATARERTGRELSKNTIAVAFGAPRIAFGREGGLLNLQFGPTSEVALDTTFLDSTLRICRGGSNGVPFVFRADTCREGEAFGEDSKLWASVLSRPPLGKPPIVAALLVATAAVWQIAAGFDRALSLLLRTSALAIAIAAGAVLRSTGGIVVDGRRDAPDAPAASAAPLTSVSPAAVEKGAALWTAAAAESVKAVKSVRGARQRLTTTVTRSAGADGAFGAPPDGFEWGAVY